MYNDSNFTGRTPRTMEQSKFGPYARRSEFTTTGHPVALYVVSVVVLVGFMAAAICWAAGDPLQTVQVSAARGR
jgi:hypothetical protein